jgi:hypothetical protein
MTSADAPMPCTEALATTKPQAVAAKPISNPSLPRHSRNTDAAQTGRTAHDCSLTPRKPYAVSPLGYLTRPRQTIRSP